MRSLLIAAAAGATLCAPAALAAQSLETRINELHGNMSVRFSFPARPEVCGDGENLMIVDSTGNTRMNRGARRRNDPRFDENGRLRDCRRGPVVIDLVRARMVERRRAVSGCVD